MPNTAYVFALNAYNEADGEDGEKVFVTATTQPGDGWYLVEREIQTRLGPSSTALWPPTAVRGVARGNGVVDVSWKDPNPEENSVVSRLRHYVVQLVSAANICRSLLFRHGPYQSNSLQKVRSNSKSVKLTGLLPGKEYEVAVKVVAEDGRESPWSIRDVVVTPAGRCPPRRRPSSSRPSSPSVKVRLAGGLYEGDHG